MFLSLVGGHTPISKADGIMVVENELETQSYSVFITFHQNSSKRLISYLSVHLCFKRPQHV